MTAIRMLAACIVCLAGVQAGQMKFTTIARGDLSRIEEARTVVARTAAEWTAVWKEHGGEGAPPRVDWGQAMVAGVFLGDRPTAGYAVEIMKIEKQGNEVVVTYREQTPAPDAVVAQMLTTPFHLVRTEAFGGPVRFTRAPR